MSDIKTMPDIEVGDFLLSRDDKQQGTAISSTSPTKSVRGTASS